MKDIALAHCFVEVEGADPHWFVGIHHCIQGALKNLWGVGKGWVLTHELELSFRVESARVVQELDIVLAEGG